MTFGRLNIYSHPGVAVGLAAKQAAFLLLDKYLLVAMKRQ